VHGPYSVNAYSAVMTRGERVIAVSETIRDYILANYPGVDPAIVRVIHRGVDPDAYPRGYRPSEAWLAAWREAFPASVGKRLLTLPARVTRWKGQEDFIEMIAWLRRRGRPVHGLLVGEAHPRRREFLAELRDRARAAGVEADISFCGHRADLREIMAISSIVFSLSREPEAFGRVSLEALGLGVPVIAYDHGGVAEQMAVLLPEGRVAVGDWAAAAERAEAWLDAPPEVRADNPFTLARMLDATLAVYDELAT
jgi:glycosyltransferase involved in cell wall biosynthesis